MKKGTKVTTVYGEKGIIAKTQGNMVWLQGNPQQPYHITKIMGGNTNA